MRSVYKNILKAKEKNEKLLAILLDPDKLVGKTLTGIVSKLHNNPVDLIFVGGSTVEPGATDLFVKELKELTHIPVVLFPGDYTQITDHADAILFLSLLSGRNPEYLIDQQLKSVDSLQKSSLEIIPTGYILVDGGKETAVQKKSRTQPILQEDIHKIVQTAVAGMYLGKKLIYLEAGSGAKYHIDKKIIAEVHKNIDIPLIVGGGIKTQQHLEDAYQNGADIVVIGNGFEENYNLLSQFKNKLIRS
ncbi:MAG: geranylgeranylglyceryl/heptaprenylglyceryl phosphate synthase [Flavobacteriia bacterium]|nr:MAG: geranylgeranylglyceryl/heptaprenylglyceryl phosphate synthase [Flavobacteriia bacterium]